MKEPDKHILLQRGKYKARPCFSHLSFGDLYRLLAQGSGVRLLILCLFLFNTSIQAQWTQFGNELQILGNTAPLQCKSVSISADGKTALVGGYNYNIYEQGSLWIIRLMVQVLRNMAISC